MTTVRFGPEHLRSLERMITAGERLASLFENCSTENTLALDDLRELRDRMRDALADDQSVRAARTRPAEPHDTGL